MASLRPPASLLPFKYVGGDASLDLVNTVDWTTRGLEQERLGDYERLTRWAEGAEVIVPRRATRLRTLALAQPRTAERVHREAIELRRQLRELFSTIGRGGRLDQVAALEPLNVTLRAAMSRLELLPPGRPGDADAPLQWNWRDAAERLDSLLWPVLRSAADLLTSDEGARVRECGGEDCGWLYVDRSRNGLRRWCEMETCGNREKAKRRASSNRRSAR